MRRVNLKATDKVAFLIQGNEIEREVNADGEYNKNTNKDN